MELLYVLTENYPRININIHIHYIYCWCSHTDFKLFQTGSGMRYFLADKLSSKNGDTGEHRHKTNIVLNS